MLRYMCGLEIVCGVGGVEVHCVHAEGHFCIDRVVTERWGVGLCRAQTQQQTSEGRAF